MLFESKAQVLQELETNKQHHLEASRNEHLWALGSDSMETSTMHEDNRVKQIKMAEFYDELIKFLEKI
jgi:hypothetical protein